MRATSVFRVAGCWFLILVWNAEPLWGATRRVPTDFSTIQAAVEASGAGDTVLVLPGTYRENILITRDVWLRSAGGPTVTVIDGSSPSNPDFASVVAIISPESPRITGGGVEGFDIRNGHGTRRSDGLYGGGVFIQWTGAPGPLIRNNWIHDNQVLSRGAVIGGGLSAQGWWSGVVRVIANRIYHNALMDSTYYYSLGSAVAIDASSSQLEGNEIFDNHVHPGSGPENAGGSAVFSYEAIVRRNIIACNEGVRYSALLADGLVEGNTIVANWANADAPAVWMLGGSDNLATVFGNNITHNVGPGLWCRQWPYPPFTTFTVECNNVASNYPGGQIIGACSGAMGQDGNISVDPEYGRGTGCPSSPGDWCLGPNSPLLPQNSPPGCGLIGALGLCPPISVLDLRGPSASFRALPAQPNPFFERTTIAFYLPERGGVEISIYGVLGRKVRTLTVGALSAGENELEWDGRGDDGELAASGAYVAVIRSGGAEVTRTLLLVR